MPTNRGHYTFYYNKPGLIFTRATLMKKNNWNQTKLVGKPGHSWFSRLILEGFGRSFGGLAGLSWLDWETS